eukprot:2822364-Prymnesium_polylepis.1
MGISVLGPVGAASGKLLREVICQRTNCDDALAACTSMGPTCDVMELREFSSSDKRAILRASYSQWGARTNDPSLLMAAERCRELSSAAMSNSSSGHKKRAWARDFCDELSAPRGEALPALKTNPSLDEDTPKLASRYRPEPGTQILLVTYANRPSHWLCSFLRTVGYGWDVSDESVRLVVLGWRPDEFTRANVLYYTMDRVYALLGFLESAVTLAPDAI